MATGLSINKWANDIESHAATNSFEYSLTYEGKLSVSDVLKTTPANVELLFSNVTETTMHRNMLLFAENLNALSYLLYNKKLRGRIRLVYIDPPFATKQIFQSRLQKDAYIDVLTGSHYIEFLRQRLILIRELLSNDGSIYVHLDENIVFETKLIMDEVFGKSNYRNFITRKKCNTKNYTHKVYGNISDYILFYSKNSEYVWNRPVNGWSKEDGNKEYQYIEEGTGRRYKKVPIHAPGVRNGETGKPWRGMLPPPGKHWQYTPTKLEEMDKKGEMFWSSNGNPRRKIYLDQNGGIPIQDIWLDYKDAHNQNIEITGYPTEKNYEMLQMIVNASSNSGDIVLDCFSGSGTTLVAADILDRKWIGIDSSIEAINTTLNRFFHGTEKMGDFVSNKKTKDDTTISLFDSLETLQDNPEKVKKTIKIPAFEFYVQDTFGIYNDDLVKGHFKNSPEPMLSAVSKSIKSAINHLSSIDPVLNKLIKKIGTCLLNIKPASFEFLVEAILNQQLSKKAADTIVLRVRKLTKSGSLTYEEIAEINHFQFKTAGVSERKAEYISDLCNKTKTNELNLANLEALTDDEIITMLTKVKGIGTWTAHMFLIFALCRTDVFPSEDIALKNAIMTQYGLNEKNFDKKIESIVSKWKPYRSIASWYLWASTNSTTKE